MWRIQRRLLATPKLIVTFQHPNVQTRDLPLIVSIYMIIMCVSWQVICREHLMKGETKQQVEQVKAAWILWFKKFNLSWVWNRTNWMLLMCPWGSVASEAGAKAKGQSQEPSQDGSCEARRRSDWGCGWRKARSTRWCWRRMGLGLFVVCLLAAFFLQSGVTVWQNSSRKTIQTHVILKRLNSKMAARLLIWFEWFTVAKLSTCFEVWCHVLGYSNPYLGFFRWFKTTWKVNQVFPL